MNPALPRSQSIYDMAKSCLGKDLCGNTNIAYGCAETVNSIVEAATGQTIGGGASTYLMYQCLIMQPARFQNVQSPIAGDIIISPSGYSTKGVANGHVGIVGKFGVLSNNSTTGLLQEEYTLESWSDFFGVKEGFPIYYFHVI